MNIKRILNNINPNITIKTVKPTVKPKPQIRTVIHTKPLQFAAPLMNPINPY